MMFDLEASIRSWKGHLRAAGSVSAEDLEELETHVRDSVDDLTERGVTVEEAFLVSVRRLGELSALNSEYSVRPASDAWKHLLVAAADEGARARRRRELTVVALLGVLAALLVKTPALFGYADVGASALFYAKNLAIVSLLPVALYFVWKRGLPRRAAVLAVAVAAAAATLVNLYPSIEPHHSASLIALHLPILGVLLVGLAYTGPSWRNVDARLDFVRFAGEVFIFSVLIGLGGIVLVVLTSTVFGYIGVPVDAFAANWIAPCGLVAILVVASYLVERKKSLLESIAPVLARIFVPLFLVVVVVLVVTIVLSGRPVSADRSVLIGFDVLLAVVLGLVLYTMSARDAAEPFRFGDAIVLALVVASLVADAVALVGVVDRLYEYGLSANKLAALGENIVLFGNLVVVGLGYVRFAAGRTAYHRIVAVQMRYLPVYAFWAALVVVAFPPIFGFG